jgi:hypothetical protein
MRICTKYVPSQHLVALCFVGQGCSVRLMLLDMLLLDGGFSTQGVLMQVAGIAVV